MSTYRPNEMTAAELAREIVDQMQTYDIARILLLGHAEEWSDGLSASWACPGVDHEDVVAAVYAVCRCRQDRCEVTDEDLRYALTHRIDGTEAHPAELGL